MEVSFRRKAHQHFFGRPGAQTKLVLNTIKIQRFQWGRTSLWTVNEQYLLLTNGVRGPGDKAGIFLSSKSFSRLYWCMLTAKSQATYSNVFLEATFWYCTIFLGTHDQNHTSLTILLVCNHSLSSVSFISLSVYVFLPCLSINAVIPLWRFPPLSLSNTGRYNLIFWYFN